MKTIMIKHFSTFRGTMQLSGQQSIDTSVPVALSSLFLKAEEDIGMQIRQRKALCQVLFIELCKCLPSGLEGSGRACKLPSAEVAQRNPQRQISWAPAGRGRLEAPLDLGTQIEKTTCLTPGSARSLEVRILRMDARLGFIF